MDEEEYLRGQRCWKRSSTTAVQDEIKRSLAREASLVKAQQRMQVEADKFGTLASLAKEKSADRQARISDISVLIEREKEERAE